MSSEKKIFALVGMPGSGKSAVAEMLTQGGIITVRFGDETDRGLREKGLPLTEENERSYRETLRKNLGMAAYAIKSLPYIEKVLEEVDIVVIDGLYSWEEYLFLKEKFPALIVIAIIADRQVRYNRLAKRTVRPLTADVAWQRDHDEVEQLHKGGPIAVADFFLVNNTTIADLQSQVHAVLQKLNV